MATSFVSVDYHFGFWIHDADHEVFCWALVEVIDNNAGQNFDWLKGSIRDHIYYCSQGFFVGFLTIGMDDFIGNAEDIQKFDIVLKEVEAFFKSKGDVIGVDELNSFQKTENTRHYWFSPLEVVKALKLVSLYREVIHGQMKTTARDPVVIL
ncbi:hypothetical protein [Flavihumibacter petaseus]|uniref:Uncharacterized protein n=1 Tax=Flavihumibacter petaseus NBRC 106054 TaxID=1220578 RepID=A0A0E9MXS0_9BACT|nr:hypothetical protein [Flavihumibacter petaseus]GAO42308.1 hypothetical protein FPE01S_01_13210 [Flavihumibacter petaseus NBRC 106054]